MYFIYPFKEEISFGTVYIDTKNIEKGPDKALEFVKKEIFTIRGICSKYVGKIFFSIEI
jgi:hypothetical protein